MSACQGVGGVGTHPPRHGLPWQQRVGRFGGAAADRDLVDPEAARDGGRHALAAAAEQAERGAGQRRVVAAPLFRLATEHQPRQGLDVRHGRIRIQPDQRMLRGTRHADADVDRQAGAQRQDVEARIVDRPLEEDAAAADRELLPVAFVGAIAGIERAAGSHQSLAVVAHAQLAGDARVQAAAAQDERRPEIGRHVEVEGELRPLGDGRIASCISSCAARSRRPRAWAHRGARHR